MVLTDAERAQISDAIRDAEARTTGEIVCVLAAESPPAFALPILIAALAGLASPWLLVAITDWTVLRILLVQLAVFVVMAGLLGLPRIRRALVPKAARRRRAHDYASEQFIAHGLHRTRDRTGILIFVSLGDRYARILADDGIAAKVPQHAWQSAVDELTARMSRREIADGFLGAIAVCAGVLEQHFPRAEGDRNELPNRIYEI